MNRAKKVERPEKVFLPDGSFFILGAKMMAKELGCPPYMISKIFKRNVTQVEVLEQKARERWPWLFDEMEVE